jgi:hypothetical protein
MKIVLIIAGSVVLLIAILVAWLYFVFVAASKRNSDALNATINPAMKTIVSGGIAPTGEIGRLAAAPTTRSYFFRVLKGAGHGDLFPSEYSAPALLAESDLVRWLTHPNELNAAPDEIALVKEIDRTDGIPPRKCKFYVFKFRTLPPHWAAKDGWMVGVAGPYWDGEETSTPPPGVFSRFEPLDALSPEEHLRRHTDLVMGKKE